MSDTPADLVESLLATPIQTEEAPAEPPASAQTPASPFALKPISAADPCGPDLDLEGDAEFLNFLAAAEGLLPAKVSEFYELRDGQRASIDFRASFATIDKLMSRTLDVRVLVMAAKLSALNGDVEGFARRVGGLAWLIGQHWEAAHPRGDGGDYSARLGQLMALEDNATVLFPLQYARLLEIPRDGGFCYRDQLVATGAAQPRSVTAFDSQGERQTAVGEKIVPQKTIDKILRDVELAKLVALVETLRGLVASIQSIKATTIEMVGFESVVGLPKLEKLVVEMTEFVRAALVVRDPTLGPPPEAMAGAGEPQSAAAAAPGSFASRADVDAALASAFGYFATREPTSPALLLIGQARETLGKNLYEVMKLLTPPHADNARVFVGPEGAFTVPVKVLADTPSAESERAPAEPAPSRAAALALIDSVAQHMQRAEPSSPAPFLLERARNLATRDFLSLLYDMLPEDEIAELKRGR
jgi:type VI secretion system protein ImpA